MLYLQATYGVKTLDHNFNYIKEKNHSKLAQNHSECFTNVASILNKATMIMNVIVLMGPFCRRVNNQE